MHDLNIDAFSMTIKHNNKKSCKNIATFGNSTKKQKTLLFVTLKNCYFWLLFSNNRTEAEWMCLNTSLMTSVAILPLLQSHDWSICSVHADARAIPRLFSVKAWCPFPQSLFWNISAVILRHLNKKLELAAETCRGVFKRHPLHFGLGVKFRCNMGLEHRLVQQPQTK